MLMDMRGRWWTNIACQGKILCHSFLCVLECSCPKMCLRFLAIGLVFSHTQTNFVPMWIIICGYLKTLGHGWVWCNFEFMNSFPRFLVGSQYYTLLEVCPNWETRFWSLQMAMVARWRGCGWIDSPVVWLALISIILWEGGHCILWLGLVVVVVVGYYSISCLFGEVKADLDQEAYGIGKTHCKEMESLKFLPWLHLVGMWFGTNHGFIKKLQSFGQLCTKRWLLMSREVGFMSRWVKVVHIAALLA